MIYFDQAATSYYRPDCVVTAVIEALANAGNSSRSATGPLFGLRELFMKHVKKLLLYLMQNQKMWHLLLG